GNVGDFYDNRDREHSPLNMSVYPQLQKITYSAEDLKFRRDWAAQGSVLSKVVFGNSSTSAPFLLGGSNPRHYYSSPRGLDILYQHYTHNNIYIYPEHRDHDPGHNGKGDGYGDAYPTNTPYLITSQGSSGSDQPFMQAIPFTLAAFRPEVKKKLVEAGLLMPTLQMIFRSTNKHLKSPEEYLTGKAHPSVFEGSWVNDLEMIKLAHVIEPGNIPPMVQLKVEKEDQPILGIDYFEVQGTEKLADAPASISRIFRGKDYRRKMVVSAEGSYDINKRPLKYHWVILRGDPKRITIKPLGDTGSKAEIEVAYHERRPISPGSPMESNRVDIGVFVHNGVYYSAPGFITFFSLDHEARTYDEQGRIVEIGYGMGETSLTVSNWSAFFELAPQWKENRETLLQVKEEYKKLKEVFDKAEKRRNVLQAELQKAAAGEKKAIQAKLDAANKAVATADKAINDFLDRPLSSTAPSIRRQADSRLWAIMQKPDLVNDVAAMESTAKRKDIFLASRKQMVDMGMAKDPGLPFTLVSVLKRKTRTNYEDALLEQFHGTLLSKVAFPGIITSKYQVNYVDPRISAPRTWRDVYRYDAKGQFLGWTRYSSAGKSEFTADGFVILKKDDRGRCLEAQTVRYVQDPPSRKFEPNWNPLRQVPGDEMVTYEYSADQDRRGRIKSRSKMKNEK
ncbi:MAG TPA: hypothetical protein VKE98_01420, partial [Gemmataceae bacterium]|nr:hypothetical protein [Gemmataceae bacterium]